MNREVGDYGAEHDWSHDDDADAERDDDVDLARARPGAAEDVGAEERTVGERGDTERELHDRGVLITECQRTAYERCGPEEREPPPDAQQLFRVVSARHRRVEIVGRGGRKG